MNKNETLTLWLSIGAAVLAIMLFYSYIQEKSAEVTKKFGAMTSVVVAVKNIGEMQTIDESMVELKEYPEHFVQPGALLSLEEVVGFVSLAPMRGDEQVLATKITRPGPTTGLSLQISPTKRALTVPVDEMRAVAKLLKPGDRVDIIAALDVKNGPVQKREIKTIMQDVLILATGLKVMNELPRVFEEISGEGFIRNVRSATDFRTITIEVDPLMVQNLVYVLSTSPGSLFFSLRHPSDHDIARYLPSSSIEKLLGKPAKRNPARTNKPFVPKLKR